MTAIGIVGTANGFIIGADGRKCLDDESRAKATAHDLSQETDCAQKIFELKNEDMNLAYTITGSVADSAGFDLLVAIAESIAKLKEKSFPDCNKFLRQLGGKINKAMNEAKRVGTLETFPKLRRLPQSSAWIIADILVVGYFKNEPCFFMMNFYHYHQISEFRVVPQPVLYSLLSGSGVVAKAMFDERGIPLKDSPFAQHARELRNPTLDQADEYVRGYIEACSLPLALEMDEAMCKGIGGHMHVAEITVEGFKWRVPPKSL